MKVVEIEKRPVWREILNFWPLICAASVTLIFVFYSRLLAMQLTRQDGVLASRYEHFLAGRPNELGDTLAGFVGSLTLVWVVASVIQQSMELRSQRREFAEMVKAQDAQVAALQSQTDIFKDEQRDRTELRALKLIQQLLLRVDEAIMNGSHGSYFQWVDEKHQGAIVDSCSIFAFYSGDEIDDRIFKSTRLMKQELKKYKQLFTDYGLPKVIPVCEEQVAQIVLDLDKIHDQKVNISEADVIRLERIGVFELSVTLSQFSKVDERFAEKVWGKV